MAETTRSSRRFQMVLGFLVAALTFLLSFTQAYQRAELVTYDWRFHLRNLLFGLPPMDPRLGTIDIDNRSVEVEGRYQDWTRDKYTDVVRILHRYGARMVGFDVYFIEPSARSLSEQQLRSLKAVDSTAVMNLLDQADYDQNFSRAIAEAGNVYLAQFVVVPDPDQPQATPGKIEARSPDQEAALAFIRQHSPRLVGEAGSLWQGVDFEPPLKLLREVSRGFAYAQTVADPDGARRRYPLVYQYEGVVFPSIALLMICDYLQVPIETVEVRPGHYVRLPNAHFADGRIEAVEVPIDRRGNMYVNWAGKWDETFTHYSHYGLRQSARREERQQVFDKLKELVAANPALRASPGEIPAALAAAGVGDQGAARAAVITYLQAGSIEQALRQKPQLSAAEFWKAKGVERPSPAQTELFSGIQRTDQVAAFLEAHPQASLPELQAALPQWDAEGLRQSAQFALGLLVEGRLPATARPLFFYPYVIYQGQPLLPSDLKGKILFYGLTAAGTTDLSVTPFQGSYPMVGIYPNVLNTILSHSFIHRIPVWLNALLILGIGVLLSLVIPRFRVLHGALLVAGLLGAYVLVALVAFTHANFWLEVLGPVSALIIGYLAMTIYGYLLKEKEKEFVQSAFGHYLSPAVVDEIMKNPGMIDQLGGEERVMTAFFSDIASFSTISECLTASELVRFINEYLSEMCDIIENYGGTIDKFEGDAIVAFFGAPIRYEDHTVRGCMACIDQQHGLVALRQRWKEDQTLPPRLHELRQRWERQGRLFTKVRMGLTCGPMVVGNMGSRRRTDYTMMGDVVNLAARFESGQKIYGTNIMVNDQVYDQVKDLVETRRLDLIQVMGKEEPVTAYEVLDRKGKLSPQQYEVLDCYARAMERYDQFDFAEARKLFEQALQLDPHDGPSLLYADRCEEFALNPPKDLVYRAQSK
ncbi:MAG: CHASE2 domain-containing protein [Candidatus Latescibacteria bacterium]|nr:CHASE2 domain-containing protein [Candidatus Latescibacterota bacterium]